MLSQPRGNSAAPYALLSRIKSINLKDLLRSLEIFIWSPTRHCEQDESESAAHIWKLCVHKRKESGTGVVILLTLSSLSLCCVSAWAVLYSTRAEHTFQALFSSIYLDGRPKTERKRCILKWMQLTGGQTLKMVLCQWFRMYWGIKLME